MAQRQAVVEFRLHRLDAVIRSFSAEFSADPTKDVSYLALEESREPSVLSGKAWFKRAF
jgi:hypothetical protein